MTPEQQARAEIARRRAVAQAATPGPWKGGRIGLMGGHTGVVVSSIETGLFVLGDRDREARDEDGHFIAANDPAHVLRVLDAAEATLDRHAFPCPVGCVEHAHRCTTCDESCPCPDAAAVIELYAPKTTSQQVGA